MSSAEAFEGADDIRRSWLAGLAPDPSLTVSQWADRHRVLSSRSASEAGPYRTSRTPYMRGIMDALSPRNPVQRVVFMKTAQVGATEAGNNWIGFCIHRAPGPFLAVQPTVERKRRLRPIEFQLSGCGDVMKRRAVGSSSGTTRRGPYAPSACCA